MDNLSQFLDGLAAVVSPVNLLVALIGVLAGTAVGVLPGIGPAMTAALLLPSPTGWTRPRRSSCSPASTTGMYGGSTTSILLNTPGESASVITAIEGNKMAKAGASGAGAGDRGDPFVRRRYDRHLAVVLGASRTRGFAALLLRLVIGLVGIDVVVVAVGIFAVGEATFPPGAATRGYRAMSAIAMADYDRLFGEE